MSYLNRLAETWNEWREDIIDPIGSYISLAYNSLIDGVREGFPKGFSSNAIERMNNPDVEFFVSLASLNRGLDQYLKNPIPLDKDNSQSNNYIHIHDADLQIDDTRNVIILKIKNGRIGFEALKIRGGTLIKSGTIEIVLKTAGTKIDIYTKFVSLDFDNVPQYFDKAFAQGLDSYIEEKGAIASQDLGNIIKSRIPIFNRKEVLQPIIDEICIFAVHDGLNLQTKYKI